MLAKSVLLLASAALTIASPLSRRHDGSSGGCPVTRVSPELPKTGGSKELPAPPPGLELKHIALGFGIQNYTCSAADAAPTSTGALAMLYDITALFPGQSNISLSAADFNNLSTNALFNHDVPLNLEILGTAAPDHNAGALEPPFTPDAPLCLPSLRSPLPFLGHHFFDSQGNPVFDLDNGAIHVVAAKDSSVDAPPDASKGLDNTGAVAWLSLTAKKDSSSQGASLVYRVVTAGGNSHGCQSLNVGEDSTPYAAQYWFFG